MATGLLKVQQSRSKEDFSQMTCKSVRQNKLKRFGLILFAILCFCSVGIFLSASNSFAAGLTIVTHGYNSGVTDWVDWMGYSIVKKFNDQNASVAVYTLSIHGNGTDGITGYSLNLDSPDTSLQATSGQTIIKLDWSEIDTSTVISTETVAANVVIFIADIFDTNSHFLSLPIHLIGHSRGGSLVCEMARLFGNRGIVVDQVTTLDPKPVDGEGETIDFGDAPARTYENVLFADNYWQDNLSPTDMDGQEVSGAYNRRLVNLSGGYPTEHSDTHLWYHGTIDGDTPLWDGDVNLTQDERDENENNWYEPAETQGQTTGYYYSLASGGNRLSTYSANIESNRVVDGYHEDHEGGGSRTELDWSNANWPNIITVELLKNGSKIDGDSAEINIGYDTFNVKYTAQDYDSSMYVSLYLDSDRNPFNNNNIISNPISTTKQFNATAQGYSSFDAPINTLVFPIPQSGFIEGYIYARVHDASRSRYMYMRSKIKFILSPDDARLVPDLYNLSLCEARAAIYAANETIDHQGADIILDPIWYSPYVYSIPPPGHVYFQSLPAGYYVAGGAEMSIGLTLPTLSDLIATLQVISGKNISQDPIPCYEINGDGRIGTEEAIYLMQILSGMFRYQGEGGSDG